jgi:hypothetical protein
MVGANFTPAFFNKRAFEEEFEFFLFLHGAGPNLLNQSFETHVGNLRAATGIANQFPDGNPNAVSELNFTHRAADGKKFPSLCRHAAARVPSESQPCSQAFVECLKISRGENAD